MKFKKLIGTDLVVSEICLGTMTFGEQNTQADAFAQLDKATKEYGINFIDTAESYPVPSAPTTSGESERIIGKWLKKNKREDVIISTNICGHSDQIVWCRDEGQGTRINRKQVIAAVDAQLKRLGTDYIDLLQFHWPDRYVPLYGAPEYHTDMERPDTIPIREQLEIISDLGICLSLSLYHHHHHHHSLFPSFPLLHTHSLSLSHTHALSLSVYTLKYFLSEIRKN